MKICFLIKANVLKKLQFSISLL